jgi:hypothetical protein
MRPGTAFTLIIAEFQAASDSVATESSALSDSARQECRSSAT